MPADTLQRVISLCGVYLVVKRLVIDNSLTETGHFTLSVEVIGTGHTADLDVLPFVGAEEPEEVT